MTTGTPETTFLGGDVPISSRFLFEVDGVEIGIFAEVSGLALDIEVVEIAEGGLNSYKHKKPGRVSWTNITLKRGITDSDALFDWVNETVDAVTSLTESLTKKTAAITAIAADGTRLRAWNLVDAFAVKWSGPSFSIDSDTALSETIEIAHHGFTSETF